MRNMTLICATAAGLALAQGCGGESGTVGASGGLVTGSGSSPTTSGSGGSSASSPASSAGASSASSAASSPSSDAATSASSAASSSAAATGHWQPTGELEKAEPIDQSIGPDQTLTALWPKGQPADHALTIKLLAKRNGDKLIVTLHASNNSGQRVSLLIGAFGGASAVDENGQSLEFDEFDKAWTLTNTGDSAYLQPGEPMLGDIVMTAPKSGTTFNLYWPQAVNIGGIILIRDIPIVG